MTWYYYVVVGVFGLIMGSFFNVCIYRLPRKETLGDRSRCPDCGKPIAWYDNIPLISYALLRGRCRQCGGRISMRYPLVEAVTGIVFVLVYWWSTSMVPEEFGLSGGSPFEPEVFIGLILVSVLIISVGTDITDRIVPDRALLPGAVLMLAAVTGAALYRGQPGRIGLSVTTGFIGGGFWLAAGLLYGLLMTGKAGPGTGGREVPVEGDSGVEESVDMEADEDVDPEDGEEGFVLAGIGMGDVKLMFFIGLALGYFHWYLIFVEVLLSSLVGTVAAVVMMLKAGISRKARIAFVPYIAIGAVVTLFWGQKLVDLYLRLFR